MPNIRSLALLRLTPRSSTSPSDVRPGSASSADCSGLMKRDTHLGENARQIEVSDDQATSFLSAEFKRKVAGLVPDQSYSQTEASRSLGVVESVASLGYPTPAGVQWCDSAEESAGA